LGDFLTTIVVVGSSSLREAYEIDCLSKSVQYNLAVEKSMVSPLARPKLSRKTRLLEPSRPATSIRGFSPPHEDQYMEPEVGSRAMAEGPCKSFQTSVRRDEPSVRQTSMRSEPRSL